MLPLLAATLLAVSNAPPPDDDDDRRAGAERPAAGPGQRAKDGGANGGGDEDEDEEGGRVDPNSPIVVTAHRLDAARTRIDAGLGATVYALSNDAVENRPGGETGSIAAILTQTPGASPSGSALAIRGSRAIQVRINDVIVPEAISDPAEHLSARLAETTRVMTGTLPAQFGFAPGGVIAVTTKSGTYQHGGEIEAFAGSDGMVEPAAEWAGSLAGTSLFASGSFERERTRIGDAAGLATTDLRRGIEGLAFADHLLGDNDRVSFILGGSRERHEIGPTGIGAGRTAKDDAYAVATFQHSARGFTLQTSLFAGSAVDEARFAAASREHRSAFGTQIDAAQQVGTGHVLRAGLLVARSRTNEVDARSSGFARSRTPASLYAQDEWKIGSHLTFNPGVRLEWLGGSASGAAVQPRASLVWAPSNGLSAHVGYARYAAAAPYGEVRPRPLPDERDDVYDAGFQQRVGPFTFGVDAYLRSARNLIAEREDPGEAAMAAFAFQRAKLRGVEFSATYAHGPVTAWANLALSRGRGRSLVGGAGLFAPVTLVAAAANWIPLASERPVLGSGGLTWRIGAVSLSGDFQASSGTVRSPGPAAPNGSRAAPFAVFGLAAVHHLRLLERPTDLRLDLTNVTGTRYFTRDASTLEGGWTVRGRGRALTIGIEQGF